MEKITNINALYWTENISFSFGDVFWTLVILKPYAAENIVIPTWKLFISEFNE